MGALGNGYKTLTRLCSRRPLAISSQHLTPGLSALNSGGRLSACPPRWRFVHNSTSQKRIAELQDHAQELYPRVLYPESAISCRSFSEKFQNLLADESAATEQSVVLHGLYQEVSSYRILISHRPSRRNQTCWESPRLC